MTQEEIKKFDKKVLNVQDPFGTGFLLLYRLFRYMAVKKECSEYDVMRQYLMWKLKRIYETSDSQ